MTRIKKTSIKPATWSGGRTWTYYIDPKDASVIERNFHLRISTAEVEIENSSFSDFSGYTRIFSVFTNPVVLSINGSKHTIRRGNLIQFSGSDIVKCNGKTVDFNVFYDETMSPQVKYITGEVMGPKIVILEEEAIVLEESEWTIVESGFSIET